MGVYILKDALKSVILLGLTFGFTTTDLMQCYGMPRAMHLPLFIHL